MIRPARLSQITTDGFGFPGAAIRRSCVESPELPGIKQLFGASGPLGERQPNADQAQTPNALKSVRPTKYLILVLVAPQGFEPR